ncbi:hypothetical protein C8R44DRAFT_734829 [Mycena epipterygia]|nr:hypothetical protein C8R44DRAFT_734829 [Mycena epipterygia]
MIGQDGVSACNTSGTGYSMRWGTMASVLGGTVPHETNPLTRTSGPSVACRVSAQFTLYNNASVCADVRAMRPRYESPDEPQRRDYEKSRKHTLYALGPHGASKYKDQEGADKEEGEFRSLCQVLPIRLQLLERELPMRCGSGIIRWMGPVKVVKSFSFQVAMSNRVRGKNVGNTTGEPRCSVLSEIDDKFKGAKSWKGRESKAEI